MYHNSKFSDTSGVNCDDQVRILGIKMSQISDQNIRDQYSILFNTFICHSIDIVRSIPRRHPRVSMLT